MARTVSSLDPITFKKFSRRLIGPVRHCALTGLLTCTASAVVAQEANQLSWRTIDFGGLLAVHNLEGPAVTGYNDDEGEDDSSVGGFIRARTGYGSWFHLTADLSVESIGSEDVTLVRGTVAPGVHYNPSKNWSLYAELGAALVATSGLDTAEGRTAAAQGDGGTDIGLVALLGARNRIGVFEWHIAGGYMFFGEENYPAGSPKDDSPGDGPIYELGAAYHINNQWAISATWTGAWVEDAGFEMDLATQQLRIGARWSY